MENKLTPIDFSISLFQTNVVCLIIKAFKELQDKDAERYYSVDEFYELFNKRAFSPFELTPFQFNEVIIKIAQAHILTFITNKGTGSKDYKLNDLKAGSGLIND